MLVIGFLNGAYGIGQTLSGASAFPLRLLRIQKQS